MEKFYDTELQMYVDPIRKLNGYKLLFMRWLNERGGYDGICFNNDQSAIAIYLTELGITNETLPDDIPTPGESSTT